MCAILCVLKTGATWRDLPDSFPDWSATCCYFGSWPKKDESGKSAIDKAPGELMLGSAR
ncbi:MAG: transposase [Clostridiales bacterium]|nr:transposase [Clostridiales bacterium]